MAFDSERFMATTYGFATSEWETARGWVAQRLHKVARGRGTITYSDLTTEMTKAGLSRLDPHSSALAGLLGQINLLEHKRGRPLISAVVVYKTGDLEPGPGFWEFARHLGVDPGAGEHARLEFWAQELERCFTYWASH